MQQETYLWRCEACEQEFPSGSENPLRCTLCGRKTNGGLGLPFAASPDFTRVDEEANTYQPYEGESDWVRSANQTLAASVGAKLRAMAQGMHPMSKRRAVACAKNIITSVHKEKTP